MPIIARLIALNLAATLILGCAGTPAKAPAPIATDPPGTLRSKDGKVGLVMPRDWIAVDAEAPAFRQLAAELGGANPKMRQFVRQSSGALLLAVCATQARAKTAIVDTVSVKGSPSNGQTEFTESDIQRLRGLYAKQMDVDGKVSMEPIRLDAGAGLHFAARVRVRRPGSPGVVMYTIGYLVFHGDTGYTITFTAAPERARALTAVAALAIKTLSFGRSTG